MVKRIPLTQGHYALVDDGDYDWLNQWKWTWAPGSSRHSNGYAKRARPQGEAGPRFIFLHRLILEVDGLPVASVGEVDHSNRDTLDNRRSNLRLVTHAGNQRNTAPRGELGEKGVRRQWNRWQAYMALNGRYIHLGMFATREEARAARKAYEEGLGDGGARDPPQAGGLRGGVPSPR